MQQHSLFQLLDSSLSEIPVQSATVQGEWSTTSRKTYASAKQLGTGDGPFLDVVDSRWIGTLSCASEVGAMAFLLTKSKIYWAKASAITATLPIQISLSSYADYPQQCATFSASIAAAFLPGVPIAAGTTPDICTLGPQSFTVGRVTCFAEANGTAFLALVLPRTVLKVGRNHLWRLRDDVAASCPQNVRELLTRRRAGRFDIEPVQ